MRRRVRARQRRSTALDAPLDAGRRRPHGAARRAPSRTSSSTRSSASPGCRATLWALERGVTLALANKESLVAAGELALAAQERGGGRMLPVDSEHSAALPVPRGARAGLRRLARPDRLRRARSAAARARELAGRDAPTDALAHPTWSMGPKITVDSATLANKGLELIEAHFLFGLPYDRIEVVVHPTSIVHSLVRFRDGAALAHLGYPDMRVPISYALTYPERAATADPAARPRRRADARVRRARPGDVPAARARARGRRARRHATRARSTPPTRSPSPRSSTGGCRSSASPTSSRTRWPPRTERPARDLGRARRGRRRRRGALAASGVPGRMNIFDRDPRPRAS